MGDTEFQEKCVVRMKEFLERGVAIVFVSHNLSAILDLCGRSVLMSRGGVVLEGASHDVVSAYLSGAGAGTVAAHDRNEGLVAVATGVQSLDDAGAAFHSPGSALRFVTRYRSNREIVDVVFTFIVKDARTGMAVYAADSTYVGLPPVQFHTGDTVEVSFDFRCNLLKGTYSIDTHAYHPRSAIVFESKTPAAFFQVTENESHSGTTALFPRCSISRLEAGHSSGS